MKKTLFTIILSLFISSFFSQSTISWSWLDSAYGGGTSIGLRIQVDKYDNTYVLGALSNGDLKIGTDSIYSMPSCLFMTKYNSNGQPLWLKKVPTTDTLGVFCVDSTSNIFISVKSSVMRFDNSLNLIQSKPTNITIGPYAGNNGHIYLFGQYTNTFSFSTYSTVCTGTNGIVMIEMDTLFNIINAQKKDFTAAEKFSFTSFDFNAGDGSIYLGGKHTGNLNWFNGIGYVDNTGSDNLYFVKLKHDFTAVWAKYLKITPRNSFNNANFFAMRSDNNNLSMSLLLDSLATYGTATITNIPSANIVSTIVLRLDTAGNYLNYTRLHGNVITSNPINLTIATKIQYDSNGNQYVMTALTDTTLIANTTTVNLNYGTVSQGITPFYPTLLKFNSNGTLINTYNTGYVFDFNGWLFISDIIVKDTGTIFFTSRTVQGPNDKVTMQCGSTKKPTIPVISNLKDNSFVNLNKTYPNPFEKNITISGEKEINSIKIYDNLGKLQYKKTNLNTMRLDLDLQQLKPGIYHLQIFNANGSVYNNKIIKE